MLNVTFAIEGHEHPLLVVAYHYRDELSKPFSLELEVLFEDAALDFEPLLGAPALAQFHDEPFLPRVLGVVEEIEQKTFDPEGRSHYFVRVVPPLALLAYRTGHHITQNKSLVEIAQAVAASAGQPPILKLGSYDSREYTVQYGERDLGFMQRLLAEVGVGFFFDHEQASSPVFFDDLASAATPQARVPYRPLEGRIEGEPHVHFAHASARIRPGKVTLRDYDYERPELDLSAQLLADAPRKPEHALELFEVEIGDAKAEGNPKSLAKRILEELRTRASTAQVLASFALPAGAELTIDDAPRAELHEALVVLSSDTRVTQVEDSRRTESRLTVSKASAPFRPARLAKPRIWSTQTAFVVGEQGEEIDVDDQGRVKVVFHWDRRGIRHGAPTRRIRVSQAWAGPGYGLMTVPRIGDEVVVSYLDGDPDEPLIIGRVHNKVAPAPLNLPAEKTRSIWKSRSTPNAEGANHIMMEDLAGQELLELSAQLDMNEHVNRHATKTVGENASESVYGNSSDYVKGFHTHKVDGSETIDISGLQSVNIGMSQNVTIGASQSIAVATHQTISSAILAVKSGPIGVQGTGIVVNGSSSIDMKAPVIAMEGVGVISGKAPTVVLEGGLQATMSAPTAAVVAGAVASLISGGHTVVDGLAVTIGAGATIEVGAGGSVTIMAPKVILAGQGLVQVEAPIVNVAGSAMVNITGAIVAIN